MRQLDFLKKLDSTVGRLCTLLFRIPGHAAVEDLPGRLFLFIRPGGVGDAILLLPVLHALRTAYPGCRIDILAEKRNAAAFSLSVDVNTVYLYDSCSGLAKALKGRYDVVIDTEQWYRLSAIVARLVRAPVKIGFGTNERGRLFTHPVSYDSAHYEAEVFSRLLEPLGIPVCCGNDTAYLAVPADARSDADRLLAPLSGRPFVTVFPGASVPEKQWGEGRFRELIAHLGERGLAVVILGGGDTRRVGARLATATHVLDLTGSCSLVVSAAVLARGRMLLSGDSGLLHIAAGLGVPTVSLFGPSDPKKWAPRGRRHLYLCGNLACAPCSRFGTIPPCERSACCLSEITVAQVVAGIDSLLVRGKDESPRFMRPLEEPSGKGN